LQPFYDSQKQSYTAKTVGVPAPAKAIQSAAEGYLTGDVFLSILRAHGFSDYEVGIASDLVNVQRQQQIREAGIKHVQAALQAGEMDATTATEALANYEIPADAAAVIVQVWSIEMIYKVKPLTPGQLCEYASKGWVSAVEYKTRLRTLGYTSIDIDRIMRACNLKALEAKQKTEAANAKKRVSEEQKAQKLAASAANARRIQEQKLAAARQKAAAAAENQQYQQIGKSLAEVKEQIADIEAEEKIAGATILPKFEQENPPPPSS
jgi:hypothetical protein